MRALVAGFAWIVPDQPALQIAVVLRQRGGVFGPFRCAPDFTPTMRMTPITMSVTAALSVAYGPSLLADVARLFQSD
jgi:hypothetical protein